MITAVDTNALPDVLISNKRFYDASVRALDDAACKGSLVICDLVYAELCIRFHPERECESFLKASEIRVESLNREAHFLASLAWRAYRKQGGRQSRILADFLIGSHAQVQATRLLSRIAASIESFFLR